MPIQGRQAQLEQLISQAQHQLNAYKQQLDHLSGSDEELNLRHLSEDIQEQIENYQDELAELGSVIDKPLLDLTTENFTQEVFQSEIPVLIDCWAVWCGPCKQLTPIIEALSRALAGQIKFCRLNVDEAPAIASQLNVQSLPTTLLLRNARIVDSIPGVPTQDQLRTRLQKVIF